MKNIWFRIVIYRQLLTLWARGKIFDFIHRKDRHYEGYCMCGSRVEDHGFGDGHGAVDSWYYYRDRFVYGEKDEKW